MVKSPFLSAVARRRPLIGLALVFLFTFPGRSASATYFTDFAANLGVPILPLDPTEGASSIGDPTGDMSMRPEGRIENGLHIAQRLRYDFGTQIQATFQFARRNPIGFAGGLAGLGLLIASDRVTFDLLAPQGELAEHRITEIARPFSSYFRPRYAASLVLGFGSYGFLANSEREKETAGMLVEALVTSSTWTHILKNATGRERPRTAAEYQSDWIGPLNLLDVNGRENEFFSFPSGHATGSWATATILAHQYPTYHIVPIGVYGLASAASYSRIALKAHWLSDVVSGALIGYFSAKQVIRAHERDKSAAADQKWHAAVDYSTGYKGLSLEYNFD